MTLYRLFYAERGNPDNSGEGLPLANAKEANDICRWHNKAYPAFKHWVEKENVIYEQE